MSSAQDTLQGHVNVTIAYGTATVEFFHPQSNSLPSALLRRLADEITATGRDPEVRVIILKSGGERAFCAGASFDELSAIQTLEEGIEFFSGFAKVINALRKVPQLVIGRVQGKTVGGGVGLACATDYCLATTHASVKLSELAVGIGPFVVGPAVERKVGLAAMSQLAIDASNWQTAEWARDHGMYCALYDTVSELDAAVMLMAHKLAESNPQAVSALKSVFWEGTDHWDELLSTRAAVSGKLVLSDFTKNAIASFKAGTR